MDRGRDDSTWDKGRVLRLLAGGLFLAFVAMLFLVLLAWPLARDLALWILGQDVSAEIVDRWVLQVDEYTEGEPQFEYYLEYRFSTSSGKVITRTTTVSLDEWASADGGQGQVDVVYFPPYPEHNRLDDARYMPLLACSYLPAILIAVAVLSVTWHLVTAVARGSRGGGSQHGRRREWWGK